MSDNAVLLAETRDRVGKGTSRALRREGRLPAVIYGDKKEPVSISLATKDVVKAIHRDSFLATVYTVEVGSTKYNVLPRDLQLHPVSDTPIHIDFLRVSAKSQIAVMVPVHFLNDEDCVGVRRGGVLNVVRHEVRIAISPLQPLQHLPAASLMTKRKRAMTAKPKPSAPQMKTKTKTDRN